MKTQRKTRERAELTAQDMARLLGIGVDSVAKMVRAGALPGRATDDGGVAVPLGEMRRWLTAKNERALRTVASEPEGAR